MVELNLTTPIENEIRYIVLYYQYVTMEDEETKELCVSQEELCNKLGLKGRVRIANEGINGTLGGTEQDIDEYIETMKKDVRFVDVDWKKSWDTKDPFGELLVRHVKEIVSMDVPDADCDVKNTGVHLDPEQFHKMIDQYGDSAALIDVRNNYEYNIGHFEGAMNPDTRRFGQFPDWCRRHQEELQKKEKVLMYCTGGIRCEKASSYLRHLGIQEVYQLSGGIHRYMEKFVDGGHFKGKNFVFDERVCIASEDKTIVGKCENCSIPYDTISGSRCTYCRMHVILCETCRDVLQGQVYCKDHNQPKTMSLEKLNQEIQDIQLQLQQVTGRHNKGRRRSLRKKYDSLQQALTTRTTLSTDE